jgi:VanZ family protein
MKLLWRWLPVIIIMSTIFYLSSLPGKEIIAAGLGPEPFHIGGHFFMYFFLYIALYRATKSHWKSLLIVILYSLADEYHQIYTPGRSASLKDLIVDTSAGLVAGGLIWTLYPRMPKILKSLLEA